MRFPLVLFFLILPLGVGSASAQDSGNISPAVRPAPIQDNSFLIEEAYNQEDGIIQHISTFERLSSTHDWVYTRPTSGRCEASSTN